MKLSIPGVPAKYNTIAVIAVVVILLLLLFPNIMKNIIGGAIKGVGGGIKDGLNDILNTPVSSENQSAMNWLDQWGQQNSSGSFLSSQLYDNSPGDASIDASTAKNLLSNVKDTSGWFSDDMGALQGQFQTVVGNQTDISYVASLFMQDQGAMMGDWLSTKFHSKQPVILMNFIKWGASLPIN